MHTQTDEQNLPARCPLAIRSKHRRLGVLALLSLSIFGLSSLSAQMVTNYPVEAPGAFGNPLVGFRNDLNGYSQYPYRTVVRQYIRWNEIENSESDTVQKIRDFCNAKWSNLPADNIAANKLKQCHQQTQRHPRNRWTLRKSTGWWKRWRRRSRCRTGCAWIWRTP